MFLGLEHSITDFAITGLFWLRCTSRVFPTNATIDAGPNLHLLCAGKDAAEVARRARENFPAAQVLDNGPGEGAQLSTRHLF